MVRCWTCSHPVPLFSRINSFLRWNVTLVSYLTCFCCLLVHGAGVSLWYDAERVVTQSHCSVASTHSWGEMLDWRKEVFYVTRTQHILFLVLWDQTYGKGPFRQQERKPVVTTSWSYLQGICYMHHPTDRIIYRMAFVTPGVEHWMGWEIAQWVFDRNENVVDNWTCSAKNLSFRLLTVKLFFILVICLL